MLDGGDGTSRFVWTADLLPDEIAHTTAEMMERGVDAVKSTLEADAGDSGAVSYEPLTSPRPAAR